jgi:hypothetical protein
LRTVPGAWAGTPSSRAVALLRRPGRTSELLDLLGTLDADRLLAIYYALPQGRRSVVERDYAWAYHVWHAPHDEIKAALGDLEGFVVTTPTSELAYAVAVTAWGARASA